MIGLLPRARIAVFSVLPILAVLLGLLPAWGDTGDRDRPPPLLGLCLNEVVPQGCGDGHGGWVEIYNSTAGPLSTQGLFLGTDWKVRVPLPVRVLPGGERLLLRFSKTPGVTALCYGKTALTLDLGSQGGFLGLFDLRGRLRDAATLPHHKGLTSFGRVPDGRAWVTLDEPTPGRPNPKTPPRPCIVFSPQPGRYARPVTVTLKHPPGPGCIRFTLDGKYPNEKSPVYKEPLALPPTACLRAAFFPAAGTPGTVTTGVYVTGLPAELPVLAVTCDPSFLFDPQRGILRHPGGRGMEWERPCRLDFFDTQNTGFSARAGLRVAGGVSRRFRKKSFRIYFRKAYGPSDLFYPILADRGPPRFHTVRLRASGNDQRQGSGRWTLLRDALNNRLFHEMGGVATGWRFALLVMNGRSVGLFDLREHVNAAFLRIRFGMKNPDLLKRSIYTDRHRETLKDGDRTDWDALGAFLRRPDVSPADVLSFAARRVDLADLSREHILRCFGSDWDWPQNNRYLFRDHDDPKSRWRFVLWDSEWCFALGNNCDWNQPTLPRVTGRTDPPALLFHRLMQNPTFRKGFAAMAADTLNSTLTVPAILRAIEEMADEARPGIPEEVRVWGGSQGRWEENVQILRKFALARHSVFFRHVAAVVPEAGPPVPLTVTAPNEGRVQIDSIILPKNLPFHGTFFSCIPVKVKALPDAGYRFTGWGNPSLRGDSLKLQAARVLLPRGASWRNAAPEEAPPKGWTEPDFWAKDWEEGPALLGYGDDDVRTELSFGKDPANKRMACYFRGSFHLDELPLAPKSRVAAHLLCDDGAVVYLNGAEVGRINMPAGPIAHNTPAATAADPERNVHLIPLPPKALRKGRNTLAVEVHQCSRSSSDLAFDLAVTLLQPIHLSPRFEKIAKKPSRR